MAVKYNGIYNCHITNISVQYLNRHCIRRNWLYVICVYILGILKLKHQSRKPSNCFKTFARNPY